MRQDAGFNLHLRSPANSRNLRNSLTVSRFAPPQQARLYVIEIPDEGATGNNHNTMREEDPSPTLPVPQSFASCSIPYYRYTL